MNLMFKWWTSSSIDCQDFIRRVGSDVVIDGRLVVTLVKSDTSSNLSFRWC